VGSGSARQLESPSPRESSQERGTRERGVRKRRMGALGSVGYDWQCEGTASVVSVSSWRYPSAACRCVSESGIGNDQCAAGFLAPAN